MASTRMGLSFALVCLVASASLATPIVPVAQTRSVTASASHPSGTPSTATEAAPDFEPFGKRVRAMSGPAGEVVDIFIHQRSLFHEDEIHMLVDGFALRSAAGVGDATASSIFDITFDLTVTSAYDLDYNGLVNSFTSTSGSVSDASGVVLELLPDTHRTGTLDPGRYRIQIFASGRAADVEEDAHIHQHLDLFFTPVPEPSTALLVAAGTAALALVRGSARRR